MALTSLYKTPEFYLLAMIERVQELGSRLTDFTEGSVTRTFYEGLVTALSEHTGVLDQLREDSYLATATGEALDRKAGDYDVARKAATFAAGTVRITRTGTGMAAVTIPAGWGNLATVPGPGEPSIAYVTLEDAIFAAGTGTQAVDVDAIAVVAGAAANNSQGADAESPLIPVNPVGGFSSDTGFVLRGPVSGGVDGEPDDKLRARVPIEVQGRVKGREAAFLAAALRVPGVESAQVLQAGDAKPGGGAVPAGNVEVYYEGSAALLGQVTSEVIAASVLGQDASAFVAAAVPAYAKLNVFTRDGVDVAALQGIVQDAVIGVVEATGVAGTAAYSAAIEAVHALTDVVSVGIPFEDFRKQAAADNTNADIAAAAGTYLTLSAANCVVTVTTIP